MITKQQKLVLQSLRKNARSSLTTVAQEHNMPLSTVAYIKRQLSPFIDKFVTFPDYRKLGYPIRAYFKIVIKDDKTFPQEIVDTLPINNLLRVKKENQFLVDCLFRDMKELYDFKEQLEEHEVVEKLEMNYVLETIKQEEFHIK